MQVSPVMSISKLCLDSDSNNNLRRWLLQINHAKSHSESIYCWFCRLRFLSFLLFFQFGSKVRRTISVIVCLQSFVTSSLTLLYLKRNM